MVALNHVHKRGQREVCACACVHVHACLCMGGWVGVCARAHV